MEARFSRADLGETTTSVYNAYRQLVRTLNNGIQTGTLLYGASGYVAGTTDPLGNTTTVGLAIGLIRLFALGCRPDGHEAKQPTVRRFSGRSTGFN